MTMSLRMASSGLSYILFLCVFLLHSTASVQSEFREIFNGKNLDGWKGDQELWTVRDDAITGETSAEKPIKSNTFLIWDEGVVADFELELEYRLLPGDEKKPGGNSGIQYRSRLVDEEKFIVGGYQADIDYDLTYTGINYDELGRGILAQRGQRAVIASDGEKEIESFKDPAKLAESIRNKDWNHYRVVAKGNRLSHYINDVLMSEVIDNHEGKSASQGILALQIHTGPPMIIQFRKVRLKEL